MKNKILAGVVLLLAGWSSGYGMRRGSYVPYNVKSKEHKKAQDIKISNMQTQVGQQQSAAEKDVNSLITEICKEEPTNWGNIVPVLLKAHANHTIIDLITSTAIKLNFPELLIETVIMFSNTDNLRLVFPIADKLFANAELRTQWSESYATNPFVQVLCNEYYKKLEEQINNQKHPKMKLLWRNRAEYAKRKCNQMAQLKGLWLFDKDALKERYLSGRPAQPVQQQEPTAPPVYKPVGQPVVQKPEEQQKPAVITASKDQALLEEIKAAAKELENFEVFDFKKAIKAKILAHKGEMKILDNTTEHDADDFASRITQKEFDENFVLLEEEGSSSKFYLPRKIFNAQKLLESASASLAASPDIRKCSNTIEEAYMKWLTTTTVGDLFSYFKDSLQVELINKVKTKDKLIAAANELKDFDVFELRDACKNAILAHEGEMQILDNTKEQDVKDFVSRITQKEFGNYFVSLGNIGKRESYYPKKIFDAEKLLESASTSLADSFDVRKYKEPIDAASIAWLSSSVAGLDFSRYFNASLQERLINKVNAKDKLKAAAKE